MHSLYSSVSYFEAILTRLIIMALLTLWMANHRNAMGDENAPIMGMFMAVAIFFAIEISIFNNYNAKLQLFVQVKQLEVQQAQLSDLLNAVPDSVYICSRASEGVAPKSLYANS